MSGDFLQIFACMFDRNRVAPDLHPQSRSRGSRVRRFWFHMHQKNLSSATKHFHFHWSHQCTWGLEMSFFLNNKLRLSTCISNFSFLLHPVLTDNVKMYYWWHLDDMLVHLKETNECGAVRLLLCSVRSIRHIPTSDCNRVSLTSFS